MAETETQRGYRFDFSDARLEDLPRRKIRPRYGTRDRETGLALHDPVGLEPPLDRIQSSRDIGTAVFCDDSQETFLLDSIVTAEDRGIPNIERGKNLLANGYDKLAPAVYTHPDGFSVWITRFRGKLAFLETSPRRVADFEPVVKRYGEALTHLVNGFYYHMAGERPEGETIRTSGD